MARQWKTKCVKCNTTISYADVLAAKDRVVGKPRTSVCQKCLKFERRGLKATANPLFRFRLAKSQMPAQGSYPLGQINERQSRHVINDIPSGFKREKFGVRDEEIQQLYDEIQREDTPVVIAVAPTGSGKSTFLPLRLLNPVGGLPLETFTAGKQIVITQPRRGATIGITGYVAGTLHGADLGAGHEIGYRVRGDHAYDKNNRMVYVTDGTLINWIVRGELDRISMVVIDEAHERSLNIDVIIGLLARLIPRYPHLKVLIVSATIDHAKFKTFFDTRLPGSMRCGIVECTGTKPVGLDVHWREPKTGKLEYDKGVLKDLGKEVEDHIADAIVRLVAEMHSPSAGSPKIDKGDVLGFLHGMMPILGAVDRIESRLKKEYPKIAAKTDVYPLYSTVDEKTRKLAVEDKKDPSRLRIVIASNAAETSLTIDSLVHVVESGFIKQTKWDPVLGYAPLRPIAHSQSGCRQRWGRVGRTMQGYTWCLYTKDQFNEIFAVDTTPEIQRACLDSVVLLAKRGGADKLDVVSFPWLDAPSASEIENSVRRLSNNGWLDEDEDLTEEGVKAAMSGGQDAVYSKLIRDADRFGFGIEVASLVPFLKMGLSQVLPFDKEWSTSKKQAFSSAQQRLKSQSQDDLEFCLNIVQFWLTANSNSRIRWAEQNGLDADIISDLIEQRADIMRELGSKKKDLEDREIDFSGLPRLRLIIARAFPESIYSKDTSPDAFDSASYMSFVDQDDVRLEIAPPSTCQKKGPDFLVALGPKREKRNNDPGTGDKVLLAPFAISLERGVFEDVLQMSDFRLADFFRENLPRPVIGSEDDFRIQLHEELRKLFPIGCHVRCKVTGNSDSGVSVELEDSNIRWSGNRLTTNQNGGFRKRTDQKEEAVDFRYANASKSGRKPRVQKVDDSVIDRFEEAGRNPKFQRAKNFNDKVFIGKLQQFDSKTEFQVGDTVIAEVSRYSELRSEPRLVLASPPSSVRFANFAKEFQPGAKVNCVALGSTETGAPKGLMVRELTTGFEAIIPIEEMVPFADLELLDKIPIGATFSADVRSIDEKNQQVVLTVLTRVAQKIVGLDTSEEQTAEVVRIEATENDIYVVAVLDCSKPANGLIVPVKIKLYRDMFEQMGTLKMPYKAGDLVHVSIERRQSSKSKTRVQDVSDRELNAFKQAGIETERGQLVTESEISIKQWNKLKRVASSESTQTAIEEIFLSRLELFGDRVITDMEKRFPVGKTISGVATWVNQQGIKVTLDGGITGLIPISEIVWWQNNPEIEQGIIGKPIKAVVRSIDMGQQIVKLSQKQLIGNSWGEAFNNQYPVGKQCLGVVRGFINAGAFVSLEKGLDGFLPCANMRDVHGGYVNHPNDVVDENEMVKVAILNSNPSKREFRLKLISASGKKHVEKKPAPPTDEMAEMEVPTELLGWDDPTWPWTNGENAIKPAQGTSAPPPPAQIERVPLHKRMPPAGWSLTWR